MTKSEKLNFLFLFLLGGISSFSLPPYNFFFINFISYIFLFLFLVGAKNSNKSTLIFFLYGWVFGFGYFICSLYWISISLTFDNNFKFLIPISIICIPAFISIFFWYCNLDKKIFSKSKKNYFFSSYIFTCFKYYWIYSWNCTFWFPMELNSL